MIDGKFKDTVHYTFDTKKNIVQCQKKIFTNTQFVFTFC